MIRSRPLDRVPRHRNAARRRQLHGKPLPLFTYDTYTQSGIMLTFCLSEQWMFQRRHHGRHRHAPWYPGANADRLLRLRWASEGQRDSVYTGLNNINNAKFRTFKEYGELVGHDNFNYVVSTWTHKFTDSGSIHTNTEAHNMWEFDATSGGLECRSGG